MTSRSRQIETSAVAKALYVLQLEWTNGKYVELFSHPNQIAVTAHNSQTNQAAQFHRLRPHKFPTQSTLRNARRAH